MRKCLFSAECKDWQKASQGEIVSFLASGLQVTCPRLTTKTGIEEATKSQVPTSLCPKISQCASMCFSFPLLSLPGHLYPSFCLAAALRLVHCFFPVQLGYLSCLSLLPTTVSFSTSSRPVELTPLPCSFYFSFTFRWAQLLWPRNKLWFMCFTCDFPSASYSNWSHPQTLGATCSS